MEAHPLPSYFIWRRLQSLAGLCLVVFLIEHLLVNSQAALLIGEDGRGFIDGANWIHSLPYLQAVEILILGIPIVVHVVWGVMYLRQGKMNSFPSDGSTPALTMYHRNHAYSWQRITAWLLIIGIGLHVANMRFIHAPESAQIGTEKDYMVRVSLDPGLYTLSERLGFRIFNQQQIQAEKTKLSPSTMTPESSDPKSLINAQKIEQLERWVKALEAKPITEDEVIAVAKDFGTAELLMVRNNFKSPLMIVLYTLFVLAAVFHAFNGLWTFLIAWGVILTATAQRLMLNAATALMILLGFLGLSTVWLTYWINLKT